jgi:putative ABC transport system permease protein
LALAFKLARRELRAGLAGFVVFISCIALGVAAISGVGSIARSLLDGVSSQGRAILGGDVAVSLVGREADPAEMAFLRTQGTVSVIASTRAMANAGEKGAALVEAKAVDAAYPTIGALVTEPAGRPADLLAQRDGAFGAIADPALLERLGMAVGDTIKVGNASFRLSAKLVSEPDKIGNGIGFGPRLILSEEALRATGLIQPGSLVRWTHRVVLAPGRDGDSDVTRVAADATKTFPNAGWAVRSRLDADPRFTKNIERFTQYLTLVGLTALLVGGVGVANAVRAFVERKRTAIGILKSLGATGTEAFTVYLVQVMLVAAIGIAIGLAIGAALPFAVAGAVGALLPVPINPTIAPGDLALAALYGFLTTLAFAAPHLGRAHDIPVSALFRDTVQPERRWPRARYLVLSGLAAAGLVLLSVYSAYDRRVALIFIGAAFVATVLLRLVATGVMAAARRAPRSRQPFVRLAIANLYRPGALTPTLVLSLGLGVTLLVTLAAIDGSLRREISSTLPERAPNLFFVDVSMNDVEPFGAFLRREAPGAAIEDVAMMRGRVVALGDRPVGTVKARDDVAWVLDGDRGITYSAVVPEGSTVVSGDWWPANYEGPPLVSVDNEIAAGLGLKLGDSLTVNVLGRPITARISNLRRVDWRRLGIGFVLVYSPNTFAGAPSTHLATVTLAPGADPALEGRLVRDVAREFPAITSVRVRDTLEAIDKVVSQLGLAIRVASSVALLASFLVLAGALAAARQARLYDAVILRTLGASRGQIVLAHMVEYGVLGLVTAVFGSLAGLTAAYFVVTRVMRLGFAPSVIGASGSATLAVAVAIGLGLLGTWRILGRKPAPLLRAS